MNPFKQVNRYLKKQIKNSWLEGFLDTLSFFDDGGENENPFFIILLLLQLIILIVVWISALCLAITKHGFITSQLYFKGRRSPKSYLLKAPGNALLALADFLFSPATLENTFKPIIADWREEYFNALKQGRTLKARWISVRYRVNFINAMGLSKVLSFLKTVKPLSKP